MQKQQMIQTILYQISNISNFKEKAAHELKQLLQGFIEN